MDSYAATGREINLETGSEARIGNWDEARLEQVLHNLVSNALKYSPSGTSVQVRLERQGDEALLAGVADFSATFRCLHTCYFQRYNTSRCERERSYEICPEDIENTPGVTGATEESLDAGGDAHLYGDG